MFETGAFRFIGDPEAYLVESKAARSANISVPGKLAAAETRDYAYQLFDHGHVLQTVCGPGELLGVLRQRGLNSAVHLIGKEQRSKL